MQGKATGYSLSKKWFEFTSNNPDLIRPIHTALFFYIVELWNRFGKKDKFGLPTDFTMSNIGVKSRKTYYQALNELEEFDFITIVQRSKNQNSANIISISGCVKNASAGALPPVLADAQAHTSAPAPPTTHIDKLLNKEVVVVIKDNYELLNERLISWVDAWKKKVEKESQITDTITTEISRNDFIKIAERVSRENRIISRDYIGSYCDRMTDVKDGKMYYTKYLPLHLPSSMRTWLNFPENKGKRALPTSDNYGVSLDMNPKK